MPRVVHFELGADDPERARAFYSDVFGWNVRKWGEQDYWMVTTGPEGQPGINGGIMQRPGAPNFVNTIDVPSVDEYLARITASGGTVELGKTAVPGVGWLAYCHDTEGNLFGLMEADPAAR